MAGIPPPKPDGSRRDPTITAAKIGAAATVAAAIIAAVVAITTSHSGSTNTLPINPTSAVSPTAEGSATASPQSQNASSAVVLTSAPPAASSAPSSGTQLGLTAPSGAQAATITRIVIFPGDGLAEVGPVALPPAGKIEISDVPKTITASGVGTLEMGVVGLEGPWGACASDCSKWWFSPNSVYVASFSVGGETAHALQSAPVSTGWADLGDGTWTPVYLVWQGGCIHLNLTTHDWSNVVPAATCP